MKLLPLLNNILNENFRLELTPEEKRGKAKYVGRNVTWYGFPNNMIVINKDDVYGMWGNVYDSDKLAQVVDMITDYDARDADTVELECSYGVGGVTTLTDIVEEQQSSYSGNFITDYDGKDDPATTGSDELDKYLGVEYMDELDFISDWVSEPDMVKFFDDNRTSIARGTQTVESLTKAFKALSPDNEEYEALKEFLRLEVALKDAQDNNKGDFNKFTVQLRDGHHRVMGAIEAGEEYVCLNLVDEDIKKYKGRYQLVN